MSWLDFFDKLFGGGRSSGGGTAKFWAIGISEYTKRAPIIGPYYGAMLTGGYEDLASLTERPQGFDDGRRSSNDGWVVDEDGVPRRQPSTEFNQLFSGPDDRGRDLNRHRLLSDPNLIADNSDYGIVRGPDGRDYTVEYRIGEGVPYATYEPVAEVFVRHPHPNRSHGQAPALSNTPSLHSDAGLSRLEQLGAYRPERERAAYPERSISPRPESLAPAKPAGSNEPEPSWVSEVTISVSAEEQADFNERLSRYKAGQERLRRMGIIELSDVGQFGRGLYNGVIGAAQSLLGLTKLARPSLGGAASTGPIVLELAEPLIDSLVGGLESYRLDTDPVFGGAAIIGEHLSTNLVFEGLPLVSRLGPFARGTLGAGKGIMRAPVFLETGSLLARVGSRPARAARSTLLVKDVAELGFTARGPRLDVAAIRLSRNFTVEELQAIEAFREQLATTGRLDLAGTAGHSAAGAAERGVDFSKHGGAFIQELKLHGPYTPMYSLQLDKSATQSLNYSIKYQLETRARGQQLVPIRSSKHIWISPTEAVKLVF